MDDGMWIYGAARGRGPVHSATVHVAPDGSVELGFAAPGPAGTATVAFPDGSSWTVDEADPSSLVAIHLPDASDRAWALVRHLLGPDAEELQAMAEFADGGAGSGSASALAPDRLPRNPRGWSSDPYDSSARAGALVVVADVATSRTEPPLVRIAGAVTLSGQSGGGPESQVFGPLSGPALRMAERLSELVRPDDVDALGADLRLELAGAIDRAIGSESSTRPGLDRLADRLRGDRLAPGSPDPAAAASEQPVAAMIDSMAQVSGPAESSHAALAVDDRVGDRWPRIQHADLLVESADGTQRTHPVRVEWVEDLRLRVHLPEDLDVSWVGVLRASDLLQLALAPVAEAAGADDDLTGEGRDGAGRDGAGRDGGGRAEAPGPSGRSADAVVPSGYSVADLALVVRPEGSPRAAAPAGELFRDAVDAGRQAARLTRAVLDGSTDGWPDELAAAWSECADAWGAIGDASRRKLASMYASGVRRAAVGAELGLPDRVALELVRWG